MEDRIEEKIRDGWRQVAEDSRGEYRSPNAGLPPILPVDNEPYAPAPRDERVGKIEPASVSLTAAEKKAVYAMLQAAVAQMQADGAGSPAQISPDLESAMNKLR